MTARRLAPVPVVLVAVVVAALAVGGAMSTSATSSSAATSATASTPATKAEESLVVQLTDATFEKLTQATSGSTTGDWFVTFMSETCIACMQFFQTWDDFARDMQGRVNVAEINGDLNRATARRFNVTKYPTLIYIRKGVYYPYDDFRTIRPLTDFVDGKYKDVRPIPVKPPAGIWYVPPVTAADAEKVWDPDTWEGMGVALVHTRIAATH